MRAAPLKTEPVNLLTVADPDPVHHINADSAYPVLLVCEHAGRQVPERLAGLGLSRTDLETHIGWDIGTAAVTGLLAESLGAHAILQRYSRLVVDCNRPPEAPDSIALASDNVVVPGNAGLNAEERKQRLAEIFEPFQTAVM